VSASEPNDRVSVGERFSNRFAEYDSYVLDGMVVVHAKVAFRLDPKIELAVERHELEHVVEKGNAGSDVLLRATVKVEHHMDASFGGFPIDFGVSNPSCTLAHGMKCT
jgi:hypothetical protein